MKTPLVWLLLLATSPFAFGDKLTQTDREALLDQMERIHEDATSRADARFRGAITAFRSAMASNEAALDLYLKCTEKVNFDEMQKKSGDFREWKRKNDERNSDLDFKKALRIQLQWLVLTLQAASEEPDYDYLRKEAASTLESIMSQAEDLKKYKGVISEGVIGTVFAKAYDIDKLKVEDWPKAPVPTRAVFEKIILPPLRTTLSTEQLRSSWDRLIKYEGIASNEWSGKPNERNKGNERSPEYERFVIEKLPELRWEAEVDLFTVGDERQAAINMLAHIKKYLSHPSAPEWTSDFQDLLRSSLPEPGTEPGSEDAPPAAAE